MLHQVPFRRIAVAIAFSPRREAVLFEAAHLRELYDAELILIHIGEKQENKLVQLDALIDDYKIPHDKVHICWEKGHPAQKIVEICRREQVDLLVAGALRKENLLNFYLGSVARYITMHAPCSVLIFTEPSRKIRRFQHIIVSARPEPVRPLTFYHAARLARKEKAQQLQIIREVEPLWSFSSVPAPPSERTVVAETEAIEEIFSGIKTKKLNLNISITSAREGHALKYIAQKQQADLLVLSSPQTHWPLVDRWVHRELHYLLADLPTNLLLIKEGNHIH